MRTADFWLISQEIEFLQSMIVDNKLYYALKLLSSVGIYHIWSQICVASEARIIETEMDGEFWIINPVH